MRSVTTDTGLNDAEPTGRRTQAERTAGTRAKLLDAAIDCLVELGFAKTSTQEIARRAGVSRGAQLHHFPSKESLVIAAVEHLVDRRLSEILEAEPDPARGPEILADAFSGPLFYAALELWVAARTDPALHQAMIPLERRVAEAIQGGAQIVMGSKMSPESIELSVELARGLAVSALFRTPEADAQLRERLLPIWSEKVMTS
ncbi:TetR family transcriptional regulator [Rhodococcus sp. 06-412-2C]|uniref:TetR/AcrR family transcriptional regulator n=1 Tax=unclassified Rhodococcus (in: high G+C Gram-positive bacteria) TaxID=192944 RepID=UPI000B9A6DBC|nr:MULTISPECIES: TetR/AcrR family transcriptional regulator [unclassified Rhodococcus (in: high G+C Gram-positive bacteria)]OZC84712.1 TetR family transcriptional regulator [Rhodococcus sp. 06-412-2C]OZC98366.1 TetR family transcriptional regulator [Rhodococcus sp. 06-412-2B]